MATTPCRPPPRTSPRNGRSAARTRTPSPPPAENVPQEGQGSREDQDAFAVRSQDKAAAAQENGRFAAEIVPVAIPQRKGEPLIADRDETPRTTSVEALAKLKPIVRPDATATERPPRGGNGRR